MKKMESSQSILQLIQQSKNLSITSILDLIDYQEILTSYL